MRRRSDAARKRRLRNRIKRTRARLYGCEQAKSDRSRQSTLLELARSCDERDKPFEDLVRDVTRKLDAWIEPANPVWEWVSDIGIDIAASVAVILWRNREPWLRRRLAHLEADLAELEARR